MLKLGRGLATLLSLAATSLLPATAWADSYAQGKTITFIVPYSAGGTSDLGARILADGLEDELGASVQVVNKPGAASQIGLTELKGARPDGLTIAYGVLPTLLTHYLDPERDAPYTRADFSPIAMHFQVPNLLAVPAASPFQDIGDLVAAAKAAPGTVKVGDSGLLGAPHLLVLILQRAADVSFASVHFQGGAPATTALLGGHIDVMSNAVSDVLPYTRSGEFRVLGLADTQETPRLPGVRTIREQGYDAVGVSSTAVLAPAETSPEVVAELSAAIERVVATPEHQAKLADLGVTSAFMAPDALTETWIEYEERVAPAMADARD